jgi:hypothetical protein
MEEVLVDSIPRIQPLTLKTPIVEIEADYGNPIVDGTVIVLVLGGLYIVKKILDRIKSNEP